LLNRYLGWIGALENPIDQGGSPIELFGAVEGVVQEKASRYVLLVD
jgi:hypothetical protein